MVQHYHCDLSLRRINCLTNFLDWFRNLRIVLTQERKLYVLETPCPEEPPASAPRADRTAYEKHFNDAVDVACLMLATMVPELQKNMEDKTAFEMVTHLKDMFQQQARQERFETNKALYSCKMAEGTSVKCPCHEDERVHRSPY